MKYFDEVKILRKRGREFLESGKDFDALIASEDLDLRFSAIHLATFDDDDNKRAETFNDEFILGFISKLLDLAEKNHAPSMFLLAFTIMSPNMPSNAYEEVAKWMTKAAEAGVEEAIWFFCETKNEFFKSKIAESEVLASLIAEAEHRKEEEEVVYEALDEAYKIKRGARSIDDYREAVKAYKSIKSNDKDINNQIKEMIAECEKEIAEREKKAADVEVVQKGKFGILLDRLSKEGKAQAEQKRQAIQTQAEQWKSQGLCPHCGGKIGILGSCKECKKKSSEPLAMPSQLADVEATIKEGFVIVNFANIAWRVIDMENDKVLLISNEVLGWRPYNTYKPGDKGIAWEFCTLREYLNNEFYNKLGTTKSAIMETRNNNPNNPWYNSKSSKATVDRVFLLSLDEVVKYFGDSGDLALRRKKNYSDNEYIWDQYSEARRAIQRHRREFDPDSGWWLRSPGKNYHHAVNVVPNGYIEVGGSYVINNGGIRPALWLEL